MAWRTHAVVAGAIAAYAAPSGFELEEVGIAELSKGLAQGRWTSHRLVELYTAESLAFIAANQAKPFFLYLAHNAVHSPI